MKKRKSKLELFHITGVLLLIWLLFKKTYFDNIPACSKIVVDFGTFFEQLGYAFISGYVFYLIYEYSYRRPIATRRLDLVKNKIKRLVGPINKLCILFYITTKANQNYKISLDFDDLNVNEDEVFFSKGIENFNKKIYSESSGEYRDFSPSYGDEIIELIKAINKNSRSILSETLIFQHNDYIDLEEKLIKLLDSDFFEKIESHRKSIIAYNAHSFKPKLKGTDAKELKDSFQLFIILRNKLYTEMQNNFNESNIEYRKQGIDEVFKFIHNLSTK